MRNFYIFVYALALNFLSSHAAEESPKKTLQASLQKVTSFFSKTKEADIDKDVEQEQKEEAVSGKKLFHAKNFFPEIMLQRNDSNGLASISSFSDQQFKVELPLALLKHKKTFNLITYIRPGLAASALLSRSLYALYHDDDGSEAKIYSFTTKTNLRTKCFNLVFGLQAGEKNILRAFALGSPSFQTGKVNKIKEGIVLREFLNRSKQSFFMLDVFFEKNEKPLRSIELPFLQKEITTDNIQFRLSMNPDATAALIVAFVILDKKARIVLNRIVSLAENKQKFVEDDYLKELYENASEFINREFN